MQTAQGEAVKECLSTEDDYFSDNFSYDNIEIINGTGKKQCRFCADSIENRTFSAQNDRAIGTLVVGSSFLVLTENKEDAEMIPHSRSQFNWYGKCFGRIGLMYHGYTDDSFEIRDETNVYFLRFDGKILRELDDDINQKQRENYIWVGQKLMTKTFNYYGEDDENFIIFNEEDIVGVHLDFSLKTISFSLNGDDLGVAFEDWKHENACFQFCMVPGFHDVRNENGIPTPVSEIGFLLPEKEALVQIAKRKDILAAIQEKKETEKEKEKQIEEGKKHVYVETSVNSIVEFETYTLEELMDKEFCRLNRIDSCKKEAYLCDQDFESIFNMNKEKFKQLKPWKKKSLKQKYKLF